MPEAITRDELLRVLLRECTLSTIKEGGVEWEQSKVKLALANPSPKLQAVIQKAEFHVDAALEQAELVILNFILYGELPGALSDED